MNNPVAYYQVRKANNINNFVIITRMVFRTIQWLVEDHVSHKHFGQNVLLTLTLAPQLQYC